MYNLDSCHVFRKSIFIMHKSLSRIYYCWLKVFFFKLEKKFFFQLLLKSSIWNLFCQTFSSRMAYSQWVGVLKNKIKDWDLITLLISGMWKSDVFLSIYFGSGTNSLWMLCMVIGSILEIFYVFVKMRLRRLTFPTHFNLQAGFCTEHCSP